MARAMKEMNGFISVWSGKMIDFNDKSDESILKVENDRTRN